MRAMRYLNTILTVLALLLALNLWTTWTATPGGERASFVEPAEAQGIPNAGAQRREMIDLLKSVNVKLDQMRKALTSGELRVRVRPDDQAEKNQSE